MTIAARELGMTQSAVSQTIARLEERLGVLLFERTRPLRPTSAADVLIERAGQLFAAAEQMQTSVIGSVGTGRPIARVGLVDSFAATVGPKLIPRLRGRAEHMTMWAGISRNLESELLSGKLDIMVGSKPLPNEKDIRAYPLLREPYFIVLPERMAKTMTRTDNLERLRSLVQNHTFVRYSQRSMIGVDIEKYLDQTGLVPPQSLEFDGTEAAFAMVNGGLGWMISTPLCLIHGTGVETGLSAVPLPTPNPNRALYLLARKDLDEDMVEETLAEARDITRDLVERRLADLAPWAIEMVKIG